MKETDSKEPKGTQGTPKGEGQGLREEVTKKGVGREASD